MVEDTFPKSFPLDALLVVPQQLRGKLNDKPLARLAAWNIIGYGVKIGAEMNLTLFQKANFPDSDEELVGIFDRAIMAVERADKAAETPFPWEQLGPVLWYLIERWRR
jgi:hypothetical protein